MREVNRMALKGCLTLIVLSVVAVLALYGAYNFIHLFI